MIKFQKAGFGYEKEKLILQDLDWEIKKGEIWAVLGANGSGKSTLLSCLVGINKLSLGKLEISGKVGYVPQRVVGDLSVSVLEMVVMGRARFLNWWSMPSEEDYELAKMALAKVGAVGLIDKLVNKISGGELHLVMIAGALVCEPDLLVLDEPTSALDFANQHKVMELVVKLAKKERIGVVFSTHHPELALRYADKTLMMFGNFKYLMGESRKIVSSESLSELYGTKIGVSDVRGLKVVVAG